MLDRFHSAQTNIYTTALNEIKAGKKTSHWIWYIFPQIAGLGRSDTAQFYAIRDAEEAVLYLNDSVLCARLIEICTAVLALENLTAHDIFGSTDAMKLKSSMTLFTAVNPELTVFQAVLDKYFEGKADKQTLRILNV
jgi:uncharacterized protein (DUF1810 family)